VDAAAADAKRRVHEAVARVALFGEDSDAANIAKDLLPEVDVARGLAERPDGERGTKLEKIYALHRDFNEAAFEMISSPKWAVGKSLSLPYRVERSPATDA
jgi:hypothetical protein